MAFSFKHLIFLFSASLFHDLGAVVSFEMGSSGRRGKKENDSFYVSEEVQKMHLYIMTLWESIWASAELQVPSELYANESCQLKLQPHNYSSRGICMLPSHIDLY